VSKGGALGASKVGKDSICEVVMIRKTSGGYKVLSEKGKNLGGPYKTVHKGYWAISSRRRRVVRGPKPPITANTISMLQAMKINTPTLP